VLWTGLGNFHSYSSSQLLLFTVPWILSIGDPMANAKLYVGNLSYNATEDSLAGLFSQFGEVVSARIVTDRETGRSKGFGFVEMASAEAAQQSIAQLNGQQIDGRQLTVNEARPQEPRQGGGRGFGGGGGGGGRGGYGGGGGGYGGRY
jgi:RNA recognition motif-containing protein